MREERVHAPLSASRLRPIVLVRDRSTHSELQPGTRVTTRGDVWTVRFHTSYAECDALGLVGASASNAACDRTLLLPFDRVQQRAVRTGASVVRPRVWNKSVLEAIARSRPFGSLSAAADAAIDILPYQLEPALAMLRHGLARVLIADEVGLGKTIQAGVILGELSAATETFRGIVLAPASLADQWIGELADRFGLQAEKADAAWLARQARYLPPDVNAWSLPGIYVASLDLVKRPEVLRSLEDVTWDVAVIDEAHTAGYGTARLAAAHAIGLRSRRVMLLTATPPDGDPIQLAALLGLGGAQDPLVQFRRSRSDAGQRSRRRTVLLAIRLKPAERRMHRTLARYTETLWREPAAPGSGARLAATLLRKRALSSAASLAASVRRRMTLLSGAAPPEGWQLSLPLVDDDSIEDAVDDKDLGAPGLQDAAREASLLGDVARRAALASAHESKLAALVRFLRRARQPAIVFTEYRDTLSFLDAALRRAGTTTVLLHGGMSPRERAESVREFADGGSVLLATDAASEGLNLQSRCRLVIHFELPWTPARLEQRTGRVDRLGQSRRVHEVIFAARDTAERIVLVPLMRRARLAAEGAGRASALLAVTESAVAGGIILGRQIPLPDTRPPSSPPCVRLTGEGEDEARRIMSARRLGRWARRRSLGAPALVTSGGRHGRSAHLTLIVEIRLEDPSGYAIHSEVVALRTLSASAACRKWKDLRAAVEALMAPPFWSAVESVVLQCTSASLAGAVGQHALVVTQLQARDRAIRQTLPSAARNLVQAGLFDNRAVRARDKAHRVATLLVEDSEARDEATASSLRIVKTVRLIAVRIGAPGRS